MRKWFSVLMVLVLIATFSVAMAEEKESKAEKKRTEIDAHAKEALAELFGENEKAKGLYDSAYGYAVFGTWKFAIGISGGGGTGVAVDKGSSERVYMDMGTVGVGFGLGGKKMQVIFLFQDEKTFTGFVEKGWQADASATAAAGTAAAEAGSGFVNGIAIYQITEAGVMAAADIAGTKYWKDKKLNEAE